MEAPQTGGADRRAVVAASVIGGLIASIFGAVFLIELPGDDLPGVALGSEAILVIERIVMLFTVWLLGLLVTARALAGELPIEISGRGLRYADAAIAQEGVLDSEAAFERVDKEIAELWAAVSDFETCRETGGPNETICCVDGGGNA
jgi:hypothetical protein